MGRHRRVSNKTALERSRLSSAYRRGLRLCWATLLNWLLTLPFNWEPCVNDAQRIEAILVQFVAHCHRSQIPFYVAKHATFYIQWMNRHFQGRLPRTWDALKSWYMSRPGDQEFLSQ